MKYELIKTDTIKSWDGRTLYRIKRIENGELGGYIESEKNLDQSGEAWVFGKAQVFGEARVSGEALVFGEAQVFGEAWVSGEARVFGDARVSGEAQVSGDARVSGEAQVSGEARVASTEFYLTVGPIGSRNGTLTATINKDNGIDILAGCWFGSLKDFTARVKEVHGKNKHGKSYMAAIELIKQQLGKLK